MRHLSIALVVAAVAPCQEILRPVTPGSTPSDAVAFDAAERRRTPAIRQSQFVRPDAVALRGLRGRPLPARFTLTLLGRRHDVEIARRNRVWRHDYLTGRVVGDGGRVAFAVDAGGVTAGHFEVGDATYALGATGVGDVHVLHRLDGSRYAPCGTDHRHAVDAPAGVAAPRRSHRASDSAATSTFDVLVFYTPRARSTGGGKAAIEAQIALRIGLASTGSSSSGADARFRLVHVAETSYTETGSTRDLSRFRSTSDGFMDEVHGLRDTYGGDLMALITQPSRLQYCGVAYLMRSLSTRFRSSAFGVTVRSCLGGHTLTHEMGHNIACHHDRQNAGSALYPYSYGYRTTDNRYRTIMAYRPGSRVNKWSGPNVRHNGYTMGTASADNVRSINNVRATVARFTPTRTYDWRDIPGGIRGTRGEPTLSGQGTVNRRAPIRVTIGSTLRGAPGALVVGSRRIDLPAFGGRIVPSPDLALSVTGSDRPIVVDASALSTLAPGFDLFWQAFFVDRGAAQGVSATDALAVTSL